MVVKEVDRDSLTNLNTSKNKFEKEAAEVLSIAKEYEIAIQNTEGTVTVRYEITNNPKSTENRYPILAMYLNVIFN